MKTDVSLPQTGPEIASMQANGINLTYRRWPRPDLGLHPPTVLLHGVLQTGEGMRHLAERLAVDGEVVVPDLRGRGASDSPREGFDPGTMADDVANMLERLGVGPTVLVGRLHGGLIAYQLAARRPELVCGLVLGDTVPEVSAELASRLLAAVSAIPAEFATLEEAERFYEEDLGLPPARVRHDLPSDLERTGEGAYRWRHDLAIVARIEAAAMPRSDWSVLGNVRCPTLILRGQRGAVSRETADCMVETIPNARAQTIVGAGHDVFLGPGAEQTLAAIQLFLRGLRTAA